MRPHLRVAPVLEFDAVAAIKLRRSKAQPFTITVDDESADFHSNLPATEDNAFFKWLSERIVALESSNGPLVGLPLERRGEPQLVIDDRYRLRWTVNAACTQLHIAATKEAQ
jgi:hypothetical protein